MSREKILIIETSDVSAAYTAQAIETLGYEPIFICNLDSYQGQPLIQIKEYTNYNLLDTSNVDNIAKLIANEKISNIKGVISFLDRRVKVASELASRLGVPGNDTACALYLHNKAAVQKLIPDFSPPTITFNSNNIPLLELEGFLRKYKRLIIKPTESAGAVGIFSIDNQQQLAKLDTSIKKNFLQTDEWIAQSYINGTLISLEGYVARGNVNILGFSKRYKIRDTESVNIFPVNFGTAFSDYAKNAVSELVRRSGYLNGYFHAEFIYNDDLLYLIDANFGRIAGGGISQQIALSFGQNPIELFAHIINVTLFESVKKVENIFNQPAVETVCIHYGLQYPSIIRDIKLPPNRNFYHTQIIGNNCFVPPYGENNLSWMGIVVGKPDEIFEEVEQIQIITNKGIEKPFYYKIN